MRRKERGDVQPQHYVWISGGEEERRREKAREMSAEREEDQRRQRRRDELYRTEVEEERRGKFFSPYRPFQGGEGDPHPSPSSSSSSSYQRKERERENEGWNFPVHVPSLGGRRTKPSPPVDRRPSSLQPVVQRRSPSPHRSIASGSAYRNGSARRETPREESRFAIDLSSVTDYHSYPHADRRAVAPPSSSSSSFSSRPSNLNGVEGQRSWSKSHGRGGGRGGGREGERLRIEEVDDVMGRRQDEQWFREEEKVSAQLSRLRAELEEGEESDGDESMSQFSALVSSLRDRLHG